MDAAAIQAIVNVIRIRMGNIGADLLHIEQALAQNSPPEPPVYSPPYSPPAPPVYSPPAPQPLTATAISDRLTQLYRVAGAQYAMAVHQMYFGSEIPSAGPVTQSAVLPFYRAIFGWDGRDPSSPEGLAKRQWVNNYENSYTNAPWWPALHAAPMTWMP